MSGRFRLGISGSSFLHVVPRDAARAVFVTAQHDIPVRLTPAQNADMVAFMRDMMSALASPVVAAMEAYHSVVWDRDAVLAAMLDSAAVEYWSVHCPYGRCFDPSSPDDGIRRGAIAACADAVFAASRLGARILVVHPGADMPYPVRRSTRLRLAVETLQQMADLAGEQGIRVAVEPLPKTEVGNSIEELLEIVERIDRPGVGINFDVNHLFPPEDIPRAIRAAGDMVLSVHISDQDGEERHWLPFEGRMDWAEVLAALTDIGYAGPLIYETHISGVATCEEVVAAITDNYSRLIALAPRGEP